MDPATQPLQESEELKRTPTGIPGFDEMIQGGVLHEDTIILSGGAGTGKSTFAMQFLVERAKNDEPGVYISFEEEPYRIKRNMRTHNFGIDALEQQGKLKIVRIDPQDILHIVKQEYGTIVDTIKDMGAKYVVFDSISVLEALFETDYSRRQGLLKLINWLQKLKMTSLLIMEKTVDPVGVQAAGILEFMADAVVYLYTVRKSENTIRALQVIKMRGTDQNMNLVPYIFENGIKLLPDQMVFSEF